MSPTNPRKRAAPGASPALPHAQMPLTYADPSQTASADFLQWNQQPDGTVYADAAGYDGSNSNNNNTHHQYASAGALLAPFEPSVPAAATTELARRPRHDRQLVPTAPRVPYDAAADPWPPAGDDAMRDASGAAPAEESDNIERLEERAAMAKRDSQSKRKQIPPFVQKLSRYAAPMRRRPRRRPRRAPGGGGGGGGGSGTDGLTDRPCLVSSTAPATRS